MSNLTANIAKGIIAKFRSKKDQGRFENIGWWMEKILKHEDDHRIKSKTLAPGTIFYKRPYELLHTYRDLFVEEMYRFDAGRSNPVVLDCGSNIGLSVLYFKSIYPDATIYAFEPDNSNFEILEKILQAISCKMCMLLPKRYGSMTDMYLFRAMDPKPAGLMQAIRMLRQIRFHVSD